MQVQMINYGHSFEIAKHFNFQTMKSNKCFSSDKKNKTWNSVKILIFGKKMP